ncbi:hypothetical protein GQR58_006368 [Nymphon striatum]|nr:hypothetical protein GQR58_006368 [Nymphon striatum]
MICYSNLLSLNVTPVDVIPVAREALWFPQHKGIVSGIILSGMGLGAVILNELSSKYVDPNNKALVIQGLMLFQPMDRFYISSNLAGKIGSRVVDTRRISFSAFGSKKCQNKLSNVYKLVVKNPSVEVSV